MATPLNTVSGSGTQTNTGTPQSATASGAGGTQSSSVQPGTASSVLSTSRNGGVPLGGQSLSTVSLAPRANDQARTATTVAPQQAQTHHVSAVAIAFPAGLFVLAVVLVWLMSRSAKNTTYY